MESAVYGGLGLLPTNVLCEQAGISLYKFHYLQRKFGALLVPGAVVGRWQFWTPATVELVKSLRGQIRKQAACRRAEKCRCKYKGRRSRGK